MDVPTAVQVSGAHPKGSSRLSGHGDRQEKHLVLQWLKFLCWVSLPGLLCLHLLWPRACASAPGASWWDRHTTTHHNKGDHLLIVPSLGQWVQLWLRREEMGTGTASGPSHPEIALFPCQCFQLPADISSCSWDHCHLEIKAAVQRWVFKGHFFMPLTFSFSKQPPLS